MGVEIASISRTDDMKKIKGINVWPQAVDDAMFRISEVADYQVLLTSTNDGVDVVTVRAMTKDKLAVHGAEVLEKRIAGEVHRRIGIHIEVDLHGPGEIQIDEHKARRWLDQRSIFSDRPIAVPKKTT
jgi:phenylacetate-CoA ligase